MADSFSNLYFVIPVYNEQGNVERVVNDLTDLLNKYQARIVFVDDGSLDDTLEELRALHEKDSRVNYICLSRNFGKETALLVGLHELKGLADAVVIMDGDGQHSPEAVESLIEAGLSDSSVDIVFGVRKDRDYQGAFERWISSKFYKVINLISDHKIDPDVGDFALLKKQVIKVLHSIEERNLFLKGIYSWIGFSYKKVPVDISNRYAGDSKFDLSSRVRLALTGITSLTATPLRVGGLIGIVLSFTSALFLIVTFIQFLIYGKVGDGYFTIVGLVSLYSGIMLMILGIIGEYVYRIFNETRKRPLYTIKGTTLNKDD